MKLLTEVYILLLCIGLSWNVRLYSEHANSLLQNLVEDMENELDRTRNFRFSRDDSSNEDFEENTIDSAYFRPKRLTFEDVLQRLRDIKSVGNNRINKRKILLDRDSEKKGVTLSERIQFDKVQLSCHKIKPCTKTNRACLRKDQTFDTLECGCRCTNRPQNGCPSENHIWFEDTCSCMCKWRDCPSLQKGSKLFSVKKCKYE